MVNLAFCIHLNSLATKAMQPHYDLSFGECETHFLLPTRMQVIDRILAASRELSREFETTRFAMPVHPPLGADGLKSGPMLWAFVRDGYLGAAESKKLMARATGL